MFDYYRNMAKEININSQVKIKILLFLFRVAQLRARGKILSFVLLPAHAFYYLYSNFLLGIELPVGVNAEMPLTIWHGTGIVVNPKTKIRANVTLRNGVVIGNDGVLEDCPTLDEGSNIGANAVIVGGVYIGKHVKIGPCSFVNFDVDSYKKVINCTIVK